MAGVEQGMCSSFLLELFQGVHVFPTDQLKLALYTPDATLSPETTVYSTTNEVSGTGYTAGGAALTFASSTPKLDGRTPVIGFSTVTFSGASFTTRAGLIYNSSKANRACAVLDWGKPVARSGSDFVVPWPTIDANNAILRLILPAA